MKRIIIPALIALAGFAWYYYYGPCGVVRFDQASDLLAQQLTLWNDADTIASATPRVNLSPAITAMQAIKRDTDAIAVPTCLAPAQKAASDFMNATIEGYLAFMTEQPNTIVSTHFDTSMLYMETYVTEIKAVSTCAPFCAAPQK